MRSGPQQRRRRELHGSGTAEESLLDFDENGTVNFSDLARLKAYFFLAPGP